MVNDAEVWKQKYNSTLADLSRVEAERDAAVRDIPHYCCYCGRDPDDDPECERCSGNCYNSPPQHAANPDKWHWRGAPEEE